ncbi:MAG: N-acetyltransferase [Betaproteobacteria bacterium]|nr:N-acetyltransferase [Betaproteobacteria bacterium]
MIPPLSRLRERGRGRGNAADHPAQRLPGRAAALGFARAFLLAILARLDWAPAWQQAGRDYYLKLVTGVPYTPSPACAYWREGADAAIAAGLIDAALGLTAELRASSGSAFFVRDADRQFLEAAGLLMRRGVQFHWLNRGYRDFADFRRVQLGKRKNRRERRASSSSAASKSATAMKSMHPCGATSTAIIATPSCATATTPPLLEFFQRVGAELGRRMVVFIAADSQPVASAICHRDDSAAWPPLGRRHHCPGRTSNSYHRHRVRHPPRPAALRTGRAGRAQAGARLRAGANLVGLLDCRSAHARDRGELPEARGRRDARLPGGNGAAPGFQGGRSNRSESQPLQDGEASSGQGQECTGATDGRFS